MTSFAAPLVSLAPMAGVTDIPFRRQVKAFGGRYCVSEMVASEQLARDRIDMVRRAAGADVIKPLVVQLAGREAHWMAEGARLAEAAGADVIDINMGCPSKSVTSGLCGSALMRDPDQALRLIEATVAATTLPVTLKMRLGWDHTYLNAPDIAERAEAAGVRMLTIHGRTRNQFFTGSADWAAIAPVVDAVKIPVIANGDIATAADARRALQLSGAAGVMIGRAAQGRPWLPGAIEHALEHGGEVAPPSQARLLQSLLALYDDTLAFYDEGLGIRVARKHIAWTIDAVLGPAAREHRKAICTLTDPQRVRDGIQALFAEAPVDARWAPA
ncbi:tRNA dihydrouridine synthase DusB [Terricaulis sp.]|uniref:tRNA dihydrouridine synthase DusB n=1 Tax=Terricaulis sp. TaxID=2768686 RepID=UPI002AC55103|nr:tRNA dihydrouridine synthase DusB [Terricaulis sp.]MDZ4691670.1 tRNA dihydrouridine synthase DusB [Terricaulis sp.]